METAVISKNRRQKELIGSDDALQHDPDCFLDVIPHGLFPESLREPSSGPICIKFLHGRFKIRDQQGIGTF